MHVHVNGRKMELTDALENYAVNKVTKAGRLMSKEATANVTMSVQKLTHKVEIAVNVDGHHFQAEEECKEMYEAIDKAVFKLERQLKKHKGKIKSHKVAVAENEADFNTDGETTNDSDPSKQADAAPDRSGAAVNRIICTPESISDNEAVNRMEKNSENILVYLDESTKKVKVVYKNDTGKINRIEPVY